MAIGTAIHSIARRHRPLHHIGHAPYVKQMEKFFLYNQ
jgi:hypothetical protein